MGVGWLLGGQLVVAMGTGWLWGGHVVVAMGVGWLDGVPVAWSPVGS